MSFFKNATCPSDNTAAIDESTFLTPDGHLDWDSHRIGWAVSGSCAAIASIISFYLILQHLRYYRNPEQQRYIVRICLMVPIYAIISFFSYRYFREAVYYETIRDCYEAFVIASFFILLVQFVGEENIRIQTSKKPRMKFLFPLNCFSYEPRNPNFLHFVKWGTLQYVIIRPITTTIAVILEVENKYCVESYSPAFGHLYIMFVQFVSVTVAMYCLLLFYFTMHDELLPYNPFYKFLCVKLVIFFSFWQSIVVGMLVHFGVIKATTYWTAANVSTGLLAIAIDAEMVFFSILHLKGFPYSIYRDDKNLVDRKGNPMPEKTKRTSSLMDALNPADIWREIRDTAKYLINITTGRNYDKVLDSKHGRFDLHRAATMGEVSVSEKRDYA